ncbi:hypothetical protein LDENG_00155780, partial [Lucifuga dentata]
MARCWVRRVFTLFPALAIYFLVSCSASYNSGIVYTWKQLIDLNQPAVLRGVRLEIPKELRKRRRGCRAGVERREKKRKYRPYLPSIIMGNVRSLMNKVDELAVLTRSQKEYRECSLMCFTETWLNDHIHDSNVAITSFQTVRADRNRRESGLTQVHLLSHFHSLPLPYLLSYLHTTLQPLHLPVFPGPSLPPLLL